jgi:hypothetical protein
MSNARLQEARERIHNQTIGQYIAERISKIEEEPIFKYISGNNILEALRKIRQNVITRTNTPITEDLRLTPGLTQELLTAIEKTTPGKKYYSAALFFDRNNPTFSNQNYHNIKDTINILIEKKLFVVSDEGFDPLNRLKKIENLTLLNAPEIIIDLKNKYKDIMDDNLNILGTSKNSINKFKSINQNWKDLINPLLQESINEDEAEIVRKIINEGYRSIPGRTPKNVDNAGQHCVYCGKKMPYGISGIDRADNNKTYLRTNIVLACPICNTMKHELNFKTFINKSKEITKNMAEKNINTDEALSQYIQQKNQELQDLIKSKKPQQTTARLTPIHKLLKISKSRYNQIYSIFKTSQNSPGDEPIHYHHPDAQDIVVDTHPEIAEEMERRNAILGEIYGENLGPPPHDTDDEWDEEIHGPF